jgi:WD40 repeat protein
VATLRGFLNSVPSLAFSPDGNRLATSSGARGEALKLWTANGWQDVITLHAEGHHFAQAEFSPDGNSIGVVSNDGIMHVWQAPSWQDIAAAETKPNGDGGQP